MPEPKLCNWSRLSAVFCAVLILSLSSCKSPDSGGDSAPANPAAGNPDDTAGGKDAPVTGLELSLAADPEVRWNATNGKTSIVVQYAVRDSSGRPLAETEYDTNLQIDQQPLDNESLLDQSSQELAVNLYFAMVLDASYSMTQHTPPAFEPMKSAARATYGELLDIWDGRPGEVKFSTIWFSELMNQTQRDGSSGRDWSPDDLLAIPDPQPGSATKLFSAVGTMAGYLKNEYDNQVFNGERDRYVMLVFSDGADNYSYWDNSAVDGTQATTSGAMYRQFGTAPLTLEQTKALVQNHPKLTVHVIGLGSAINETELQEIAAAGNGTFQKNPSSDNIGQLFDRVLQEFTSIQTRGAEVPLAPGDYQFTLRVVSKDGKFGAEKRVTLHAGDSEARVIGLE